jgi:hypothetical protein
MRSVSVLLVVWCLRAQEPLPPDLDALSKIRTRMLFNLAHQPNYTCVETIERSTRARSTKQFRVIDTLRLEVALLDGHEMFAWPGSKKFEDIDVTKLITTGAIGNGNFGTHARALFETRSATFQFLGETDFAGKKAIRFDYNVPQMLSGYHLRVGTASAVVGYHGSFYADPATFDIERIEVIADDIPPELPMASADDKIDYARTRIGESDFLLPSQSELTMLDLNGGENRNHVRFTSCRQYSGESVITFGDAPGNNSETKEAPPPISAREFDIPEGLDIQLSLVEDIDLKKAAIGDAVRARVDRDVKKNGQIVIPKGATATGRITRLEKYETFSVLGVEFPEIEAPGILARMKGNLESTVGVQAVHGRYSLRGGSPRQPGEGVFSVNATQLRLPKGCIMFWRT